MKPPQANRILKRDELGRVELLTTPEGDVVRRVACGCRWPGTRWVARALLRRERRALLALEGVPGVPRLLDRPDLVAAPSPDGTVPRAADVLLRSWQAGRPLHDTDRLPADFFALLTRIVQELHARGVCHNDLHKEPNILVGPDGRPAVIDFQLASLHPQGGRTFATRVREDLRHVAKHRRRYFTATGREDGGPDRNRAERSFVAAAWARFGKPPYNFVTRRVLRTRETEGRRPPGGPWPEWGPALETPGDRTQSG